MRRAGIDSAVRDALLEDWRRIRDQRMEMPDPVVPQDEAEAEAIIRSVATMCVRRLKDTERRLREQFGFVCVRDGLEERQGHFTEGVGRPRRAPDRAAFQQLVSLRWYQLTVLVAINHAITSAADRRRVAELVQQVPAFAADFMRSNLRHLHVQQLYGDEVAVYDATAMVITEDRSLSQTLREALGGRDYVDELPSAVAQALSERDPSELLDRKDKPKPHEPPDSIRRRANRIIAEGDRHQHASLNEEWADPAAATGSDPEALAVARTALQAVRRALTAQEWKALEMRADGKTLDEIAAALKMPRGSVGRLLKRATERAKSIADDPR